MYRTGNHWGRTIVREGAGDPDPDDRRLGDQLVGMVDTAELAHRIVQLLNALDDGGTSGRHRA